MAWNVSGNIKGPAGTIAIGTVSTGAAGSAVTITNSGTPKAAVLDISIPQGLQGVDGKGVSIAGTAATYSALPTGLGPTDSGKGYFVTADGDLYVWDGSAFPANGSGIAFQGPTGVAATIAIGSITAAAAGTPPSVTNSGTDSAVVLNFTIPKGDKGDNGAAATIAVGTVTKLAANATPTVVNSGTSNAAVLDIGIPSGVDGARGSKWFTGSGSPGAIAGSAASDQYLDVDSGDTWALS